MKKIPLLLLIYMMATPVLAQQETVTSRETERGGVGGPALTATQQAELVDLLDTSLRSLSDKARRDRYIGGYVLLGLGIGSGIGGGAVLATADDDDERIVGYSLLGTGVLLSGLSLLPFKIDSEAERIYREFSRMPANTPEHIRKKFSYGERRFEELAQKKRRERLIGGSTSIILGMASLILPTEESEEERYSAFTGLVIGGLASLLVKSDEEKRYDTYRRAKEDLIGGPRFGVVSPPRGGMIGAVQVRF